VTTLILVGEHAAYIFGALSPKRWCPPTKLLDVTM
jgi:hypothetical protein